MSWDVIWHLVFFFLELTLDTSKWFSVVAVVDLKVWSCKLRLDATWVHKLLLCRSLAAFNRWISIIDLIFADDNFICLQLITFFANCTDYYPSIANDKCWSQERYILRAYFTFPSLCTHFQAPDKSIPKMLKRANDACELTSKGMWWYNILDNYCYFHLSFNFTTSEFEYFYGKSNCLFFKTRIILWWAFMR